MSAKLYEKLMDYLAMMVLAFILGFMLGQSTQMIGCQAKPIPHIHPQTQTLAE